MREGNCELHDEAIGSKPRMPAKNLGFGTYDSARGGRNFFQCRGTVVGGLSRVKLRHTVLLRLKTDFPQPHEALNNTQVQYYYIPSTYCILYERSEWGYD